MHSGAKERTCCRRAGVATIAHTIPSLSEVMMNIRLVSSHMRQRHSRFVREARALQRRRDGCRGVLFLLPVLKNETPGGVVALGHIWVRCLHIAILWVLILRHQGHRTALLQAAEHWAVERACTLVTLETLSFQAPGFYAKHGYETFRVPDNPGSSKAFSQESRSRAGLILITRRRD